MDDILLVVVIVSILVGIKRPILGSIAGAIIAGIMYKYLYEPVAIKDLAFHIILGLFVGYLCPLIVGWFYSGFKGRRGKTVPGISWIGGFGGPGPQHPGGIIPNEDERSFNQTPEKQKEQFIIGLIRILIFPLVCLMVLICFSFF